MEKLNVNRCSPILEPWAPDDARHHLTIRPACGAPGPGQGYYSVCVIRGEHDRHRDGEGLTW